MRRKIILIGLCVSFSAAASEPAPDYQAPLRQEYRHQDADFGLVRFFDTGRKGVGVRLHCDLGQAIPNSNREDWYSNVPIADLTLIAEPALVVESDDKRFPDSTHGWVVIKKAGSILIKFEPKGDDRFVTWDNAGADYYLVSGLVGKYGLAIIDLLDGQGFYYKNGDSKSPEYFLSNCTRTEVPGLPVYDYVFEARD